MNSPEFSLPASVSDAGLPAVAPTRSVIRPTDTPCTGEGISALAEATHEALSRGGALFQADAGFIEREMQQRLAEAMARAIDERAALVAEAGTGVGKTFAYLVPLLLSQRRALVSTATKSLQDQLFLRDLPRLRDALKVPARIALLKGRSSYLCTGCSRQGNRPPCPTASQSARWLESKPGPPEQRPEISPRSRASTTARR
jgi:hypothetical protein